MEYECVIRVEYRQPRYRDLRKSFGCVFDGFKDKAFEPIPPYRRLPLATREVRLGLLRADRRMDSEEIFERVKSKGPRLGLYEELLAYVAFNTSIPKSKIVALGSFCTDQSTIQYAPFFDWLGDERFLFYGRHYGPWKDGDYFLVVDL